MESYCKTMRGGECLPGTVPKGWCSNPSAHCCGFEVGPRGPTVMNHLKDFIMLRSLDWGPTRDRCCPFFFFVFLTLYLLRRAEFVFYIVKESDQTSWIKGMMWSIQGAALC